MKRRKRERQELAARIKGIYEMCQRAEWRASGQRQNLVIFDEEWTEKIVVDSSTDSPPKREQKDIS